MPQGVRKAIKTALIAADDAKAAEKRTKETQQRLQLGPIHEAGAYKEGAEVEDE